MGSSDSESFHSYLALFRLEGASCLYRWVFTILTDNMERQIPIHVRLDASAGGSLDSKNLVYICKKPVVKHNSIGSSE